ncbi:MAG TPA: M48 family metalloprotease [Candidatus Baltobacteraceae bacterium]|jgi:Zn-dependent protease with chaperone function|nr:M48 family metalloprotease [Candidatus Baltobacteraceae bacterium]
MAIAARRILRGVVFVAIFFASLAPAVAAVDRPNELDRRVDAISAHSLLTQPAIVLVDPTRQEAAVRLAHLTLPGWLAMALFEAVALAYFWSTGRAAAVRDRLRRHVGSEWGVRFSFGAILGLIARVAALLPAFYLYRVERVMGLSVELTRVWALFWIGHTILAMVVAGLLAALVLSLVERTHQWYIYTIVIILAVSLGWSFASPYFQIPGSGAPSAIAGTLGPRLTAEVDRAGLPGLPVLVQQSKNSPVDRAVVIGLGASRRLELTDTLVAGNTPAEVLFLAGVAIGAIVQGDPIYIALIEGGIVIVFSALAVVIADRIGFRRDDDPLSRLALAGALLALIYIVAVPVRNASLRSYDLDNDRFAVRLTGDKVAAVRALVREADQHIEEVCPELSATLFLYAHPSPGARIAAINGVKSGCP